MEQCGKVVQIGQPPIQAIAFFTERFLLSNHYPCNINVNGVIYPSSEHYYMNKRALTFNDQATAAEILNETSARIVKGKLIYQIQGFDEQIWAKAKFPIMAEALLLKFGQHNSLWEALQSTNDLMLVEASPSDGTWGAKKGLCELSKQGLFSGKNHLGKLLMSVRALNHSAVQDAAQAAVSGDLNSLNNLVQGLLSTLKEPSPSPPLIRAPPTSTSQVKTSIPLITARKRFTSPIKTKGTKKPKPTGVPTQPLEDQLNGALTLSKTNSWGGSDSSSSSRESAIAPSTPKTIRFDSNHPKYVVCQIGHEPEMATAVKAQFGKAAIGYPLSIAVPLQTHRHGRLQVGDEIRVAPGVYTALSPRKLVHDHQKINPEVHCDFIDQIYPSIGHTQLGLVVNRPRNGQGSRMGRPVVETIGTGAPQALTFLQVGDLRYSAIKTGDIVATEVFPLPQQCRVNPHYFLPCGIQNSNNIAEEIPTHQALFISQISRSSRTPSQLSLPPSSPDLIRDIEEITAVGIKVYSNQIKKWVDETVAEVQLAPSEPAAGPTNQEFRNRYEFTKSFPGKNPFVKFLSVWETDNAILAYATPVDMTNELPCAHGIILQIRRIGEFEITVLVSLSGAGEESDYWDDILEQNLFVLLRVRPHLCVYQQRSQVWAQHLPSIRAQENTPQGRILANLLDIPHSNPLKPIDPPGGEWAPLNSEQAKTASLFVHPEAKVITQPAPPGVGKTFGAARATPKVIQTYPDAVVVNTAHSNMAMYKIVQDTVPFLDGQKALVLLSGYAKKEFGRWFRPYRAHLLVVTVEQLLERMELAAGDPQAIEGNKKFFQRYLQHCQYHPRYANETKTLARVLELIPDLPRVIFITTNLLEDCAPILDAVTHIVLDEAGQPPTNQIIPIVAQTPRLSTLLATGDLKQLQSFMADVPKSIMPYGFESILSYLPKRRQALQTVVPLWETYRFHPTITWLLSQTFYDGQLFTNIQPGDRDLLTGAPAYLTTPGFPVILLHQKGEDEKDDMSNSRHNPDQAFSAEKILRHLWAQFQGAPDSLICLCVYSAECRRLREALADTDIPIMTVDSFQANQKGLVYVVTTRSVNPDEVDTRLLEFIHDPLRTCVALSRGSNGLFIHGNLTTLKLGPPWATFFHFAQEKGAIAVSPDDYFSQIEDLEGPGAISCKPLTF